MSVKDSFEKLRKTILNTSTEDIDKSLDQAIKDISSFRQTTTSKSYINLVKNLISKQFGNSFSFKQGEGNSFNQGMASPASFGQAGKLNRYKLYQSIVTNINYCHRALNVIVDNILSPDDITKVALEIKPKKLMEDDDSIQTDNKVTSVKELITKLKLEKNLNVIVKNTLLYGDFYCEVTNSKRALLSRSLILEGLENRNNDNIIVENIDEVSSIKIKIDYSLYEETRQYLGEVDGQNYLYEDVQIDDTTIRNEKKLIDLMLVYHEPDRVVKLQSSMFPICFGYLVFPKFGVAQVASLEDQAVNSICMNILKNLQTKIPQMGEITDIDELKELVKRMATPANLISTMEIRYVPPERMQHFTVPSTKYFPYGESIFDSTVFLSKVLVSMETAIAIQRINRSTEKRKIEVEIGLPRDAKNVIEELKETFNKRKVSLDSFGSVDTIPSMISTFEDIYLPRKDGKNFVDVSSFQDAGSDARSKVEELKFVRDSLVASLGVPAAFLNIEENLSNKSALSEENILFARTIIGHQKYLSEQINALIEKVYTLYDPEMSLDVLTNVHISFAPPKSLQFERESKYITDLVSLIRSLEEIGIPREYSKKKYLTGIDWEELKNYEISSKIDKNLNTTPGGEQDQTGMEGMGNLNGGMGGMGGGIPGGGGF